MSKHEEFEELCALRATGQLTEDEELRLTEHLAGCPLCRAACDEFSAILDGLPTPRGTVESPEVVRHLEATGFREKFLAQACAKGYRFSAEVQEDTRRFSFGLFRWLPPVYPVLAMGTVLLLGVGVIAYQGWHSRGAPRAGEAEVANSEAGQDSAATLPKRIEPQLANKADQEAIAEFKNQNAQLMDRVAALEQKLEASEVDRSGVERIVSHLNENNGQLADQLEQNAAALTESKNDLEKARSDRAAVELQLGAARRQIRDLSEEVRVERASLEKDQELLVASRDITNLMGARNLHIIDVHDADGQGKDKPTTGRVFYTEGKSLVFYAYDLDEKRLTNAKYTFEAWGERLGEPASVKSLGILYFDDKEQKRWTLRVDDPRQLAHIDSVFVTLEPHDSAADKPRGHRILYAFLGGAANHP